jgi:hypothetical protein
MFNFINLSGAKDLVPVVILALLGVGIYYLISRAHAASAAANVTDPTASITSGNLTSVADLALLQSLMAGSGTGATTQLSTSQPTYTGTGSNANPAPAPAAAAPTTSGSSTGGTIVTQGA